jgi:hypothetical protein
MDSVSNNPKTNALAAGLSDSDVSAAITSSGYPLQVVVAQQLQQSGYYVQQEWSYVDSDSGSLRAIDAVASKELWDYKKGQPRTRPALALIIECKQSPLPYVFFSSGKPRRASHFPLVAGLAHDDVIVGTDDNQSTWSFSIVTTLSLDHDAFLVTDPPFASNTFSKCVRKGNTLELSGSDIYSSVVLPLLKCARHFKSVEHPVDTAYYFDLHVTIPIAVIDAPLIAVEVETAAHKLTLTPWVRLYRHEYLGSAARFDREQVLAIDVVHKDFLSHYLSNHLQPFAERVAGLAMKHADVLADGEGFVPGMGKGWREIEKRLQTIPEGQPRPRQKRSRH